MPVALGYHPYFQLHDAPRDQWKVHLAAREQYVLSNVLIPTGEARPNQFTDPQPLAGAQLDTVFGGLVRERGWPRAFFRHRKSGEDLGDLRSEIHGGGGLRAAGQGFHLLRADGGHHECVQPGARRSI